MFIDWLDNAKMWCMVCYVYVLGVTCQYSLSVYLSYTNVNIYIVNRHATKSHWIATQPSVPTSCCPHDNPSSGPVPWATGSGSSGCEHSLAMSDRTGDGAGRRLTNHGDLSAAEKHAGKFIPSKASIHRWRLYPADSHPPCLLIQLPNGVTYHPNTHQDRLGKLQEHLRMLSVLFRKLRLVYDKCNENCAGLDPIPPEVRLCFLYHIPV